AATARCLGEQQMQLAFDAATSADPSFGARAYAFIVAYVREQAAAPGRKGLTHWIVFMKPAVSRSQEGSGGGAC
ncbi:MAG: hypothetical protein WA116_05935, partial [Anaerolineaceae bacterium]